VHLNAVRAVSYPGEWDAFLSVVGYLSEYLHYTECFTFHTLSCTHSIHSPFYLLLSTYLVVNIQIVQANLLAITHIMGLEIWTPDHGKAAWSCPQGRHILVLSPFPALPQVDGEGTGRDDDATTAGLVEGLDRALMPPSIRIR
jgi:hypothetical protein